MTRSREDQELHEFTAEALSLWRITIGPIIWAMYFALLYIGTSVYCARIGNVSNGFAVPQLAAAALTTVTLVLIGWQGWRAWVQWDIVTHQSWENERGTDEDRHQFLGHAAFLLSLISFIGVVYVALPFVFVGGCD